MALSSSGYLLIRQTSGCYVGLYSHHYGYAMQAMVAQALACDEARNRENDAGYLGRILVQFILDTFAEEAETGWGIEAFAPGEVPALGDYPPVLVDPETATVTFSDLAGVLEEPLTTSFEDFHAIVLKAEMPPRSEAEPF